MGSRFTVTRVTVTRALAVSLALTLAVLGAGAGQAEEEKGVHVTAQQALAGMHWIAGSWSGEMWGGRFHAYYSTPEGGKILSHSHLTRRGKRAFYEFEVFECRGEDLHLLPYPGGKVAGGFTYRSGSVEKRLAVFENPNKDFPTRISYQRVGDDRLVITLSDPHGKSEKSETFDLRRVAPKKDEQKREETK